MSVHVELMGGPGDGSQTTFPDAPTTLLYAVPPDLLTAGLVDPAAQPQVVTRQTPVAVYERVAEPEVTTVLGRRREVWRYRFVGIQ